MVVQCLKPIAGCKAALVGVDLEIRRKINRNYSHIKIKIISKFFRIIKRIGMILTRKMKTTTTNRVKPNK